MSKFEFGGKLQELIEKAREGNMDDIDYIMGNLSTESSLSMTKFIDFSLSYVSNVKGIERIKHYLFNGTQMQRNYACLYFNRRGDWKIVKEAFDKGLIDDIQAYAR
jgi:hypothetical protein